MKATSFLPSIHKSFIHMPTFGTLGGLLVAWEENVFRATEISRHRFCITAHFQSRSNNDSFTPSTVYAPCQENERAYFFTFIDQVAAQVHRPWIMLGDFNMYRFAHKKS